MLIIHGAPPSIHTRKVIVAALEKNLSYRVNVVFSFDPPAGLTLRELEAMPTAAMCVRVGPPEQAHLVTGKIGTFVETNGYELAGPNREFFLQRPRLDRLEESVVEMQFPICKQ